MPFDPHDTIVAIATPPGRGGIGVVRLSGPDAHTIVRALISHEAALQPRHATFTRVRLTTFATASAVKKPATRCETDSRAQSASDVVSGFSRTLSAGVDRD